MWIYRDPDGQIVGFGILDLCYEYAADTAGRIHPYIPLLAVNQSSEGRGYGRFIVQHLSDEAALLALAGKCASILYLDVYTTSTKAVRLYERCGFMRASEEPLPDPDEGGSTYFIMIKRTSTVSRDLTLGWDIATPTPPGAP